MAILKPDVVSNLGGVTVNEYLLTKHNPNRIDMPTASMDGKIIGVTVHNTDWINTAAGTTPAEQYTRATVNGNMNSVRVHYYVDNTCAWQNLPHSLSGWHAADGNGDGNRKTIAIECIMSRAYNDRDKQSEDNCAKLAAALLKKYGFGIDRLFTHTHWLNVRDGRTGSVDTLNTMRHPYKWCPAYILPHWAAFKAKVAAYLNEGASQPQNPPAQPKKTNEEIAKEVIQGKWGNGDERKKKLTAAGYDYDKVQEIVRKLMNPVPSANVQMVRGTKVRLSGKLFASATATSGNTKTATYYLYDGVLVNGRYRLTTTKANCGRTPIGSYVTGWANKSDLTAVG